jgi:hypothetical protein
MVTTLGAILVNILLVGVYYIFKIGRREAHLPPGTFAPHHFSIPKLTHPHRSANHPPPRQSPLHTNQKRPFPIHTMGVTIRWHLQPQTFPHDRHRTQLPAPRPRTHRQARRHIQQPTPLPLRNALHRPRSRKHSPRSLHAIRG